MAFTYGFFNSYDGDRKYNAEQMSAIFDGIINDGIFASIGEIFATIPGDGLQVIVKTGRGWLGKTWFVNDNYYPLNLETADLTLPRLDAVIVEVDKSIPNRKAMLKVLKGYPRSTPEKPTLTNDGTIFQMPLAYVRVEASATSIQASGIDIRVGMTDCPFVTGIIQTSDITDLFQGWDEDFHKWWDNVSSVLNEDTVGKLQLQIDQLKNNSATKDELNSTKDSLQSGITMAAPAGVILMWSGAANAIPSGWALCNGQNGTPDLRDRFIVGAGSTYAVGTTGGQNTVTLTVAQMPRHRHNCVADSSNSGTPIGGMAFTYQTLFNRRSQYTDYEGSGNSHENRPPYYALCYIMKL